MRDNSFETFADKDDQAKVTYEKYRQEAEDLYLSATRRWKKYLIIFIALAVVSFIAFYLFFMTLDLFMHFFYLFMAGLATFFSCIASFQMFRNLRMEKQHYLFRLRSAQERMEKQGLYFQIPQEDYNKFNRWWN